MMIKTEFSSIEKIAERIGKIKNVKAVYLFGSYAKGKQGPLSDIDLCVIGNLNEQEESDAISIGSDNLDISIFNKLPIFIKFRVLREGKPLFIKDKNFIAKIKFYTLQEYLDFKPAINKFAMETLKCMI